MGINIFRMNFLCNSASFLGVKHEICDYFSALKSSFSTHINQYGISYATKQEYEYRFALFAAKDKSLREINANPENAFTVGHNQFSTWTRAEIKQMLGYAGGHGFTKNVKNFSSNANGGFDWRTKGGVNPVKDQAHCGS